MLKKSLVVCLLIFITAGCASKEQAAQTELLISAAASLTDSLKAIQAEYQKEHSSIKLTFNFGASGTLQQQIEQGAPADLFISAGKKQMNELIEKQLIDSKQHINLLTNELVVVVPADTEMIVHKMEDIVKPEVKRIAVGQPETVPVGSYTKESLTYDKLWDTIQAKAVFAKDVRQVLNYVATGNTEAGFVYRTDALSSTKVKVAFAAAPQSYKPIEYPAGIVKATKHAKEAEAFYMYLQSKAAQHIFMQHGFSLPKS